MAPRRLLVLGGTTESAELARALAGRPDLRVITSLAGRTAAPAVPPGELRVGGFGGTAGLAGYLVAEGIDVVVDATHPFAAAMPWHAAQACGALGIPRLRLERPPWRSGDGDRWTHAADLAAAAGVVAAGGSTRVLLTTGRRDLGTLAPAAHPGRWWLVRCITPPDPQPLRPAEVLLDRGPFALDGERRLLLDRRIDLVVTKNSGGAATAAKLHAAREQGVAVVMIARPAGPPGPAAASAKEAAAWVDRSCPVEPTSPMDPCAGDQAAGYDRGV